MKPKKKDESNAKYYKVNEMAPEELDDLFDKLTDGMD